MGPIPLIFFLNDFGKIIADNDKSWINFADDTNQIVGGINKAEMKEKRRYIFYKLKIS